MAEFPEHEHKYLPGAADQYTNHELAAWSLLFAKRATHRDPSNEEGKRKQEKDQQDSSNYQQMLIDRVGVERGSQIFREVSHTLSRSE
ncbi:hypothetical protein GCM10028806_33580 [Spirosoma terrae]|uniref:Uncharacterized protein n=1 Tax=Spirosoma terrae TaxID=1968276 RepID=A0A6L9LA41_9BACT|nr:hypothetical protein [Spirosoma terrae]NDU95673.1 hypothetical protein [Spirosoma terrae]